MAKAALQQKEIYVQAEMPSPLPIFGSEAADARARFAELTKETPRDRAGEHAFLASKRHILTTHPGLDLAARDTALSAFATRVEDVMTEAPRAKIGPVPGGVGYGMFYTAPFRGAFAQGTSLYFEIVCPNPPGGNVTTWLYLTATNRAAKGVEAFVSYNGQSEPHFRVFDWARPDPWQTDVPFGQLGSYLRTGSAHGQPHPVLPVWNSTYQIGANQWRNEVYLPNHAQNRWDLIYRFDYSATQADQKSGWVGSWGPIVETFQASYQHTNPMGALNTMLIGRNNAGQWGAWHLLGASDSTTRDDNKGFRLVFLDPNYAFVVNS